MRISRRGDVRYGRSMLVTAPVVEADRAAFLASVNGLFHEDAAVHDRYGDPDWASRGGDGYFTALLTDPKAVALVASDDGKPLGHLVGRLADPDSLRAGTRVAVLVSLRVEPSARGRGVGTALVEAFVAWSREHGAVR